VGGAGAEPDGSMNSRVSWNVEGIDPSVRERAEAAARRAGLSLNEWINSYLGDAAPPNLRSPPQPTREVSDIHQRLDSITRQIEQISRVSPRNDATQELGVARQLNDAISRLDARLSQISNPQGARQAQERQQRQADAVERAASQVYANQFQTPQAHSNEAYPNQAQANGSFRNSPPLSPASLDSAVAEIAARQSELDAAPRAMPRQAPPIAPSAPPPPPGPDFSSLERHLIKITSQIEALQRPDHLEQSIAAFRNELAEIRAAITEAMPRQAIETLESEIRSLSRRIDDNRQNGIDDQALAKIEQALAEIREALGSLKPAEQLAGYDEAIRNLGAKLDTILRANDDPSTVQQLENAIVALRSIVSNVASTDALARLSDDLHLLSSKVDQLARAANNSDSFVAIEQRIAALTSAVESREQPIVQDYSEQIGGALRALSDRIDRLQVGNDNASDLTHLEQRISYLLERLETSGGQGSGEFGRVEEGLQDILRHLERQHAAFANFTFENSRNAAPPPQDSGLIDLVKRELTDMRFSQSETDRHTQDSLEAVHSALGHVVDRLSTIEGDVRTMRSAPPQAIVEPAPAPRAAPEATLAPSLVETELEAEPAPPLRAAMPPEPKPELPNPAAAQAIFMAAPRDFHGVEPVTAEPALSPPLAISEILLPHAASSALPRPALDPELPPDHPLEPGTRPTGRVASPSERIAASEDAISEIPATPRPPVSSASFIAAARRAAQAAAAQPLGDKGVPAKAGSKDKGKGGERSSVTSKIRSLLVAASVVVIVLGAFKMAMTLLDTGAPAPASESVSEPQASSPAESPAKPAAPDQLTPSMTSPTPIGRQSLINTLPNATEPTASVDIPQVASPTVSTTSADDVTGAIPAESDRAVTVPVPPSERLPDLIGGPLLRAAALKGDASAAYEVGNRFAEGKGVPQNYDEAVKWYDRAARAGLMPAVFRLGTFYEKGLGVKRDTDIARRYYLQAAQRGNAKAMHNLAVLDADGGGKGANYNSAAQWFRRAADRGVADSQFNLGILYARGIGVEQNLAESFKWFSLAAAQGDADAALKRDDVAKRLDAQSLAAAKLAIQTFVAEPQPDDAVAVRTPVGGWDSAAPQPTAAKPAAKPAAKKTAAAR
jgi:localization factor PodJL